MSPAVPYLSVDVDLLPCVTSGNSPETPPVALVTQIRALDACALFLLFNPPTQILSGPGAPGSTSE